MKTRLIIQHDYLTLRVENHAGQYMNLTWARYRDKLTYTPDLLRNQHAKEILKCMGIVREAGALGETLKVLKTKAEALEDCDFTSIIMAMVNVAKDFNARRAAGAKADAATITKGLDIDPSTVTRLAGELEAARKRPVLRIMEDDEMKADIKVEEKAKRAAAKAAGKPTVSSRARELILAGHSNDVVFTKLREEFGLDDGKRGYPQWYRNDMKKRGLL